MNKDLPSLTHPRAAYSEAEGQPPATATAAPAKVAQMHPPELLPASILEMVSGVLSGHITVADVLHTYQRETSASLADAQARLGQIADAYQGHADRAITSRFGVPATALPAFYTWALVNQPEALRDAVLKQLSDHDVSGYAPLVALWQNQQAPVNL